MEQSGKKKPDTIPPKKKEGSKGRWVDPLIVHDDIRFGTNTFRSVTPGDPDAVNDN